MLFLVKVKSDSKRLAEFGAMLQAGSLDRGAIRSETYCLLEEPAVGYSVWETEDEADFERRFAPWRRYYAEVLVRQVIPPGEAMRRLTERDA